MEPVWVFHLTELFFWQHTLTSICAGFVCPVLSTDIISSWRWRVTWEKVPHSSHGAWHSTRPILVQVLDNMCSINQWVGRLISSPTLGSVSYLGDKTFPLPTARIGYHHLVPNKCSCLWLLCPCVSGSVGKFSSEDHTLHFHIALQPAYLKLNTPSCSQNC